MSKLIRVVSHVPVETNAEIERKVSENPLFSKSAVIATALVEKFPVQKPKGKSK